MVAETKEEKFERMLSTRLPNAVKSIELLANLASKRTYAYSGRQVDDMLNQLENSVDEVMDAFGVVDGDAPEAPSAGGVSVVVDGADRKAIRKALGALTRGRKDEGVKLLRSVVLGWSPEAWSDD